MTITRPTSGQQPIPSPAAPMTPWLLRRVNQRFRNAMRAALAEAGFEDLPQPGFWAVECLSRGAADAQELVAEMGITKQAVSKLVETLVASGYVERSVNAQDRRRTTLSLTARGRKAARVITAAVARAEAAMATELDRPDLDALREILSALAGAAGPSVDQSGTPG